MKTEKKIRVSSKSPVLNLAGSIVSCIENEEEIELRAVGAGAVNQMYKATAVARGILASKGKDLFIKPGFSETDNPGESPEEKKTVMIAKIVIM